MPAELVLAVGRHGERQPGKGEEAEDRSGRSQLRRTRNGSTCHRSSTVSDRQQRLPRRLSRPGSGMVTSRTRSVARSMSITSTNVAVIMSTPCLNRDSSTRMTIRASDRAAAVSGRRSRASQTAIEQAPGEHEGRLRRRLDLEPGQQAERREVDRGKERHPTGVPAIDGGKPVLEEQDGGRHWSGLASARSRSPARCAVIIL